MFLTETWTSTIGVTKFIIIIILGRQKHSKPKLRKSVHHSAAKLDQLQENFKNFKQGFSLTCDDNLYRYFISVMTRLNSCTFAVVLSFL